MCFQAKESLDNPKLNLQCFQAPIFHTHSLLIQIQEQTGAKVKLFQVFVLGFICPFICPLLLKIIPTKLQRVNSCSRKDPYEGFIVLQLSNDTIRICQKKILNMGKETYWELQKRACIYIGTYTLSAVSCRS